MFYLSTFTILNQDLNGSRLVKIKTEAPKSSGIYIHRYENPLLSMRKKKSFYNFLFHLCFMSLVTSWSRTYREELKEIKLLKYFFISTLSLFLVI